MAKKEISSGVVHELPLDLKKALMAHPDVLQIWNVLTPLARNEWICWVISVKKPETRKQHIKRLCMEILDGKHRPCCWAGCLHR